MFEEPAPLQPLRIPTGWAIEWNTFLEADPTFELGDVDSIGFGEDLLDASHPRNAVVIHLGWYPSSDPDGEYRLVAIRKHADKEAMIASWDRPLRSFSSRSRIEIVRKAEAWFWHFAHYKK